MLVKRITPLEGTNLGATIWNCYHCSMNVSSTWWVPCSYTSTAAPKYSLSTSLPYPSSPHRPPFPSISSTPLICWPYSNAHLKKSPENCPSPIASTNILNKHMFWYIRLRLKVCKVRLVVMTN